jgi:hypothetical protein
MKKLITILAAVSILMMASLAMGATSNVEIEVLPYCGVVVEPGLLDMDVTTVEADATASEGQHQATTTFKVQGNQAFYVVLTVDLTTAAVQVTAGMEGGIGSPYPTATMDENNAIGYGMALFNLTTPATDAWTPSELDCHLPFPAGLSDGQITINSYLDSGRSTLLGYDGKLARPGPYSGEVYLTVSITP